MWTKSILINNSHPTYHWNRLSLLVNIQAITAKDKIQIIIRVPNIKTITQQRNGINWNRTHHKFQKHNTYCIHSLCKKYYIYHQKHNRNVSLFHFDAQTRHSWWWRSGLEHNITFLWTFQFRSYFFLLFLQDDISYYAKLRHLKRSIHPLRMTCMTCMNSSPQATHIALQHSPNRKFHISSPVQIYANAQYTKCCNYIHYCIGSVIYIYSNMQILFNPYRIPLSYFNICNCNYIKNNENAVIPTKFIIMTFVV